MGWDGESGIRISGNQEMVGCVGLSSNLTWNWGRPTDSTDGEQKETNARKKGNRLITESFFCDMWFRLGN